MCVCVGFVMLSVLVICVFVFTVFCIVCAVFFCIVSFMYIYSYLFCTVVVFTCFVMCECVYVWVL